MRATVVGVVRADYGDEKLAYRVDRSTGPWDTVASADPMMFGPTTLELWVPPEQADQVMKTVRHDLGWRCTASRSTPTGGTPRGWRRRCGCCGWPSAGPVASCASPSARR